MDLTYVIDIVLIAVAVVAVYSDVRERKESDGVRRGIGRNAMILQGLFCLVALAIYFIMGNPTALYVALCVAVAMVLAVVLNINRRKG